MARRPQTSPVTAQMYRHFAVLTVAVTLTVGLFADGETREAAASEMRRPVRPAAAARPTELVRKDRRAPGSFSSDDGFDGNFGAPMDAAGAAPQDGLAAPADAYVDNSVPAGFTRYGVPAEVWASLTDAQKKALAARREAEIAAEKAPERAAQVDSLLAASRARSGDATAAD